MIVLFPLPIHVVSIFIGMGNTVSTLLLYTFKIDVLFGFDDSSIMRFLMLKMDDHIQFVITIVIHYVNYIYFIIIFIIINKLL